MGVKVAKAARVANVVFKTMKLVGFKTWKMTIPHQRRMLQRATPRVGQAREARRNTWFNLIFSGANWDMVSYPRQKHIIYP